MATGGLFTLQGLTVGAVLAGIVGTAAWTGGTWVYEEVVSPRPVTAATPSAVTPVTPVAPKPRSTPTAVRLAHGPPTAASAGRVTSSAPTRRAVPSLAPIARSKVQAQVAATVPIRGVCGRDVKYAGFDLPTPTYDLGAPLGQSVTFVMVGERSADGIPIDLLDGSCTIRHLFALSAGQRRAVTAQVGQTVIMNAGRNGGTNYVSALSTLWNVGN